MKHIRILRLTVERLGLDKKSGVSEQDKLNLVCELQVQHKGLASQVEALSPNEIEDLIVNQIYG